MWMGLSVFQIWGWRNIPQFLVVGNLDMDRPKIRSLLQNIVDLSKNELTVVPEKGCKLSKLKTLNQSFNLIVLTVDRCDFLKGF